MQKMENKDRENRLKGYSNMISVLAKAETTHLEEGHTVFHFTH